MKPEIIIALDFPTGAKALEFLDKFEAVEDNKYGLYMLDKELAARTYTQASPLATA